MKKNGKGQRTDDIDIVGESRSRQRNPGITPIEQWERDFENISSWNNIEKILEFPPINDMAGVLARANFRNDRQRVAAARLAYKNRKYHDDNHQEMLRDTCASTIGLGALGKILQTFVGTNLLAPDMFRASLGMPKTRKTEEVHRGGKSTDLRADGVQKEDRE